MMRLASQQPSLILRPLQCVLQSLGLPGPQACSGISLAPASISTSSHPPTLTTFTIQPDQHKPPHLSPWWSPSSSPHLPPWGPSPSHARLYSTGPPIPTPTTPAPPQPHPNPTPTEPTTNEPTTNDLPTQGFSIAPHLTDANSDAPLMSAQYPSSADDKFGVQKNWFTSLYKQLNYMAKTGAVPGLKDRQRVVFEQTEREFESLYAKHIRGKVLDEDSHRALLMVCLSVATYRTLYDEVNDTRLVRDVIRTNLGSVMISLLKPLHRFKLWLFSFLLREDMYKEAINFLPALRKDMGALCETEVDEGKDQTTLTIKTCAYHDILTQEDAPFLLTEFCCHHALLWLHDFRRHGVVVSMDSCKAWDDSCCQLRLARSGLQTPASTGQQQPGGTTEATPTGPPSSSNSSSQ